MKRTLALVAALTLACAGCGSSESPADDDPTSAPTSASAPPTTPTTPAPTTEPAPAPFVVAPGRIGAAVVGMTKAQAVATGLFDADVNTGDEGCQNVVPLQWKDSQDDALDVLTDQTGTIVSMGVRDGGPKTAKGIGIGSTYTQLAAAYGDELTPPVESGYSQAGVLLQNGEEWIGFLFDTTFDKLSVEGDDHTITFVEVTEGEAPSLIRDGC